MRLSSFGFGATVFILLISLLRGIYSPDFRYDLLSIGVIQLVYPVSLILPLFFKPVSFSSIGYILIGVLGISISQLLGYSLYYSKAGRETATESLSLTIMIGSYAAQVIVFLLLVLAAYWIGKLKD